MSLHARKTIFVSPLDPIADAKSISEGLAIASPGTIVVLDAGHYSQSETNESFPIVVPSGVSLHGVNREHCLVDGEGHGTPSFDPIDPYHSLVVLEDGTTVAEVSITNGGANGISVLPRSRAAIRSCMITRNGQHGIYLCGGDEASVSDCRLSDNGLGQLRPTLPRGTAARQGHHIFVEARGGSRNRLRITNNMMQRCFADGIALVCFFSENDAVSSRATIAGNTVTDCGRAGLLVSCSFGPSHNDQSVTITHNVFKKNQETGISILPAIPLAAKVPEHNHTQVTITNNQIESSNVCLALHGAMGEAHSNHCDAIVVGNTITDWRLRGIHVVGALGVPKFATRQNVVTTTVSRNVLIGRSPALALQGVAGPTGCSLLENHVKARLLHNDTSASEAPTVILYREDTDNSVDLSESSDSHVYSAVSLPEKA